jgi:hypothetical protein
VDPTPSAGRQHADPAKVSCLTGTCNFAAEPALYELMRLLETLAVAAATAAFLVAAPATTAGPRQLTLIQDAASFVHGANGDPYERLAEARRLGTDVVRLNLYWRQVSPSPNANRKPAGFVVGDPGSPGYDWRLYDRFFANARRAGLRVYVTVSGPIPDWGSREPRRCDREDGCAWKPDARKFAQFVKAVARRYKGRVRYWSIWNEPNMEGWLAPQRVHRGRVRYSARMYRAVWLRGYRAIRRYDPARRRSVLFGELAPYASPRPFLRWALCLRPDGHPIASRRRGCPRRPAKLPIAAVAHHPYPYSAIANPRTPVRSDSDVGLSNLHQLTRAMDQAARHGRIPPRRPVFITEYGIQTNPPDPYAPPPRKQARWLDESARLVYADRRVRSIAQYELVDASAPDTFNTGLRFPDGSAKPAWRSFPLPVVATAYGRANVGIWGWVRPARGPVSVDVLARRRGSDHARVVAVARTSRRGFLRVRHRGRRADRLVYRLRWHAAGGRTLYSRRATVGRPLRYRK